MMRFYWQTDADGTHYTTLNNMRANYKQEEPGLFSWWITWEGYTLVKGHAQTAKEAMAFVANWHSAYRSSIVGEALVVLMNEVKRLRAIIDPPEHNLKAGDEIRAGDAVHFGPDGKVYPLKAKPDSQDIVINGWIIKDDEMPERTGTDFSGLVLPAGDQRVGTALEHGQIDISEDKETPDENTQ